MPLRPERELSPDAIRCPRDGEPMRGFRVEGIALDRCTVCAGLWVDLGELSQILGLRGESRKAIERLDHGGGQTPMVEYTPRRCPRDGSNLTPARDPRQPHIEFDFCPSCGGVFFDSGELLDLTRFTLSERLAWLFLR